MVLSTGLMSEVFEFGCLSRDYKSQRQSVEDSVVALIRPYIDGERQIQLVWHIFLDQINWPTQVIGNRGIFGYSWRPG